MNRLGKNSEAVQRITLHIFVAAILLLVPAASLEANYPRSITTDSVFVNLPTPSDDVRWEQALSLWDKRQNAANVKAALAVFESIAADYPKNAYAWLWVARTENLIAMRSRPGVAKTIAKKAEEHAFKALALDPTLDAAIYWGYDSAVLYRNFSAKEISEVRALQSKYMDKREIVAPSNDSKWMDALSHWDKRYSKSEALQALDAFSALAKNNPDAIEPKLWMCRAEYFMHYHETSNANKAIRLQKAIDLCLAVKKIEPRNPAANHWLAASMSQFATYTDKFVPINMLFDIVYSMRTVVEEEPGYFYGSPSRFLTLGLARGGIVADRVISVLGFDRETVHKIITYGAVAYPEYLLNNVALAEYYVSRKKMKDAEKWLLAAINADPSELKLQEAENRFAQKAARDMYNKYFKRK